MQPVDDSSHSQTPIEYIEKLILSATEKCQYEIKPSAHIENKFTLTICTPSYFTHKDIILYIFRIITETMQTKRFDEDRHFVMFVHQEKNKQNFLKGHQLFILFGKSYLQLQMNLSILFRHTSLYNLKFIDLSLCELDNIQFLSYLDASNLCLLNLSRNDITQFKSIQKCNLPALRYYRIDTNFASGLVLERAKFDKQFQELIIELPKKNTVAFHNLSPLVKFQHRSEHINVQIQTKKRILQPKLYYKLAQKLSTQKPGQVSYPNWLYQILFHEKK